jgi:multiple sugar transport system substrate-binding protein
VCLADFGAGKAAILWDASNCEPQVDFQPMAEAGNIRYTTMPVAKVGDKNNSNFWTWSMAMNSSSKHKGAAWTFLQYFSSKDFLIYASTTMNNMDPTRTSVYNNPAFQAKINKLPGWYDAWQKTVPGTTIQFTPQKAFFQTTTEWAAALQDMVAGRKSVQQALDDLKKLQDSMVQE